MLIQLISSYYRFVESIKVLNLMVDRFPFPGNPLVSRERVESLETQTRTNEAKLSCSNEL